MMGSPPVRIIIIIISVVPLLVWVGEGAQWCIARSGASDQELQSALDYACGAGSADCQPIQPSGLCYLPNTLQAHASYAFNSFYQRSHGAPGSCDFAGTATITITDPSYGSCTFPSSASTAGGSTTTMTPNTSPNTNTPTTLPLTNTPNSPGTGSTTGSGGVGGLTPATGLTPGTAGINSGFGPTVPNTDTDMSDSCAIPLPLTLLAGIYFLSLLL